MLLFVDGLNSLLNGGEHMMEVPSWMWYLEAAKVVTLLGSRFVLGLSWSSSILNTFVVAVVFLVCVAIVK